MLNYFHIFLPSATDHQSNAFSFKAPGIVWGGMSGYCGNRGHSFISEWEKGYVTWMHLERKSPFFWRIWEDFWVESAWPGHLSGWARHPIEWRQRGDATPGGGATAISMVLWEIFTENVDNYSRWWFQAFPKSLEIFAKSCTSWKS